MDFAVSVIVDNPGVPLNSTSKFLSRRHVVLSRSILSIFFLFSFALNALSVDEKTILNQFISADKLFENESSWRGYHFLRSPIIVYSEDKTLFFNFPNVKKHCSTENTQEEVDAGSIKLSVCSANVFNLTNGFQLNHNVDDLVVNIFKFPEAHEIDEFSSFVIHEVFHSYQVHHFENISMGDPLVDNSENNAWATLENLYLLRVYQDLLYSNMPAIDSFVRKFIVIRALRNKKNNISAYENWLERQEGTAEFVEIKIIADGQEISIENLEKTQINELVIKDKDFELKANLKFITIQDNTIILEET